MKRSLALLCLLLAAAAWAQQPSIGEQLQKSLRLMRLEQPGGEPFHLQATIAPSYAIATKHTASIEEYWAAPDHYRRSIVGDNFALTIVVDGEKHWEERKGERLPLWAHDALTALFEVAPPETIAKLSTMKAEEADSYDGVNLRFNARSHNGETQSWWGAGCEGLGRPLTWISDGTYSAGFKGGSYAKFHHRDIAREIELFPLEEHGDVTLTVMLLEDLTRADREKLTAPATTPAEQRVALVRVSEDEARKLLVDEPAMKLPAVHQQPVSGVFVTEAVVGVDGRVVEREYIVGNNRELADASVKYVDQLRFKPLIVNGEPTEFVTPLTYRFRTTIEGDQAGFDAPSTYFKRGRELTSPRAGSQPFALEAVITAGVKQANGEVKQVNIHFTEHWRDGYHWRRSVSMDGAVFGKSGEMSGQLARSGDDYHGSARYHLMRAASLLTAEGPGVAYYSPDSDWSCSTVELLGEKLTRVAMGGSKPVAEGEYPRAAYFDAKGLLRARSQGAQLIVYKDFQDFNGVQTPRVIEDYEHGQLAVRATITKIEKDEKRSDDYFDMRGATTIENGIPDLW